MHWQRTGNIWATVTSRVSLGVSIRSKPCHWSEHSMTPHQLFREPDEFKNHFPDLTLFAGPNISP